jgi:hypothetical protein
MDTFLVLVNPQNEHVSKMKIKMFHGGLKHTFSQVEKDLDLQ